MNILKSGILGFSNVDRSHMSFVQSKQLDPDRSEGDKCWATSALPLLPSSCLASKDVGFQAEVHGYRGAKFLLCRFNTTSSDRKLDKICCQHIMLTRQMYNYEHKYLRSLSIGVRHSTLFCLPAEQAGFSWHGNVQTFPFSHTVSNALCNLEKLHQKQSDAGCHRFIRRGLENDSS